MELAEVGMRQKKSGDRSSVRSSRHLSKYVGGRGLELASNLDLLKGLDDVAHLYVVVVLDVDTALET